MKENRILALSFEFVLAIIAYCEELETCRKLVLANQLIKAENPLGLIFERHKTQRAKLTLFTKCK